MSTNYSTRPTAGTLTGTEVLPVYRDLGSPVGDRNLKTTLAEVKTYSDTGLTLSNLGTANTDITAQEYGDGYWHRTVLSFNKSAMFTVGDSENLAVGYKLYTFPAGAIVVDSAYMAVALTAADATIKTDTPDLGIGTVIASGANDVLSATATFEDILTGQTASDCNGAVTTKTVAGQVLVIEAASAHTVHLNLADGWGNRAAGAAAGAVAAAGVVVLNWRLIA